MTSAKNNPATQNTQEEQAATPSLLIRIACLACFPALYIIGKTLVTIAG